MSLLTHYTELQSVFKMYSLSNNYNCSVSWFLLISFNLELRSKPHNYTAVRTAESRGFPYAFCDVRHISPHSLLCILFPFRYSSVSVG